MLYTGKLLYAELYDDMTPPYTDVRAVSQRRSRNVSTSITRMSRSMWSMRRDWRSAARS